MAKEKEYLMAFDAMEKELTRFQRLIHAGGFPNIIGVEFTKYPEYMGNPSAQYVLTKWGAKTREWPAPPYLFRCSKEGHILLYRNRPIKHDTRRAIDFLDSVTKGIARIINGVDRVEGLPGDILEATLGYRAFTSKEAEEHIEARLTHVLYEPVMVFKGVKQGKLILLSDTTHEVYRELRENVPTSLSVEQDLTQMNLAGALELLRFENTGLPFGKKIF